MSANSNGLLLYFHRSRYGSLYIIYPREIIYKRWRMSANEYMSIKEMVGKLDEKQEEILKAIYDLNLKVSEEYLKKSDCASCKKENSGSHNAILGWILGAYVFIAGTIIAFIKAKG